MEYRILSEHHLGDIDALYYEAGGVTALMLVPSSLRGQVKPSRFLLTESLVQAHVDGDEWTAPYTQGISMRNTETSLRLRFCSQDTVRDGDDVTISTVLRDDRGREAVHSLTHGKGRFLRSVTSFRNTGEEEFDLMMLSSFSITGITPFEDGPALNALVMHRFRSYWSSEGRPVSEPLEQMLLNPSWSRWGTRCEKFSQTGSMPVRKFFPFCAVEDVRQKVTWAAQLEWAGSWQMEPYRRSDVLSLSGGLADYDTGRWFVRLKPGESFTSIPSSITVSEGGVDEACDRLLDAQQIDYSKLPDSERRLAVLYNEYCDTWGNPSHAKIREEMEALAGIGAEYFIIDAGWFSDGSWSSRHGDWETSRKAFPDGIAATARMLRDAGFIPGIWFEWEGAGKESDVFKNRKDFFVRRNGKLVHAGHGSFMDLRKPEVKDYLDRKVIRFLRDNGFGYLKTDCNESLGAEIDGECPSGGENLRQYVCRVQDFFGLIRDSVPGIIIENCASGGHRLEPSILKRTAMSSFSDAHECVEIPIIAANLHRLMQPAQSQIWAVLRAGDSEKRLHYSLANGFLGRLCLSGNIAQLDGRQKEIVRNAVSLYRECAPVIRGGHSRILRESLTDYGKPEGWQAVFRAAEDDSKVLAVIHRFGGSGANSAVFTDPRLIGMKVLGSFLPCGFELTFTEDRCVAFSGEDFSAAVVLLGKE